MQFSEFLTQNKIVLLDGAMGTELQRRGVDTSLPLWSARALMHAPHIVRSIHSEYLHAGADIITTNTFRTNIRTLQKAALAHRWEEFNLKAVQLAFEARDRYKNDRQVFIAASVAPVEECYSPHLVPPDAELEDEHGKQIEFLSSSGVDIILIETMNTIREAVIASRFASQSGKDWIVSFVCTNDGTLLSSEHLEDAVHEIELLKPTMICVNCVSAVSIDNTLQQLNKYAHTPIGVYANVGTPSKIEGWTFSHEVNLDSYLDHAAKWIQTGAKMIGGCCGTTPEYISGMKKIVDDQSE